MKKRHDGYLVISDITGYTAFLNESELEHAEDSLSNLLELLIDRNRPPLVISRLEGDAVISYAPLASLLQSQTLVDLIESMYVAFRKALEIMVANTTCPCTACRNLSSLDLKFLVHYGTFVLQKLASYDELVGTDVNLVHRLVKNHIVEETGVKAYAAYTEAAVDALRLGEMTSTMILHTENYEHLGAVKVYVQDMDVVWNARREAIRIAVEVEDALVTFEHDFKVEPSLLWEYLTKPEYRAILWGADSQKTANQSNGKTGPGAVYRCAHGKSISIHTVLDWRPFEYYTVQIPDEAPRTTYLLTYHLTPTAHGTRFSVARSHSKGPLLLRLLNDLVGRFLATRFYSTGALALQQRMEQDLAEGKVVQTEPIEIPGSELSKAVEESLRI